MGYKKAAEVLPAEVISLIQQYVDGATIYIPRKDHQRMEWGAGTLIRQELFDRNRQIFRDYRAGIPISELTYRYYLTEKSIRRIVREMKKKV